MHTWIAFIFWLMWITLLCTWVCTYLFEEESALGPIPQVNLIQVGHGPDFDQWCSRNRGNPPWGINIHTESQSTSKTGSGEGEVAAVTLWRVHSPVYLKYWALSSENWLKYGHISHLICMIFITVYFILQVIVCLNDFALPDCKFLEGRNYFLSIFDHRQHWVIHSTE